MTASTVSIETDARCFSHRFMVAFWSAPSSSLSGLNPSSKQALPILQVFLQSSLLPFCSNMTVERSKTFHVDPLPLLFCAHYPEFYVPQLVATFHPLFASTSFSWQSLFQLCLHTPQWFLSLHSHITCNLHITNKVIITKNSENWSMGL